MEQWTKLCYFLDNKEISIDNFNWNILDVCLFHLLKNKLDLIKLFWVIYNIKNKHKMRFAFTMFKLLLFCNSVLAWHKATIFKCVIIDYWFVCRSFVKCMLITLNYDMLIMSVMHHKGSYQVCVACSSNESYENSNCNFLECCINILKLLL